VTVMRHDEEQMREEGQHLMLDGLNSIVRICMSLFMRQEMLNE
jgi:hypothetical protein